jgi:uncharacterized membrane protein
MTLKQFLFSQVGFSAVFLTVIMPLLTFTGVGFTIFFMFRRWKHKLLGKPVRPTKDRFAKRSEHLSSQSPEQGIFSSRDSIHSTTLIARVFGFCIVGTTLFCVETGVFSLPFFETGLMKLLLEGVLVYSFLYLLSVRIEIEGDKITSKALLVPTKTRDLAQLIDMREMDNQRLRLIFADARSMTFTTCLTGYNDLVRRLDGYRAENGSVALKRGLFA